MKNKLISLYLYPLELLEKILRWFDLSGYQHLVNGEWVEKPLSLMGDTGWETYESDRRIYRVLSIALALILVLTFVAAAVAFHG